MQLTFIMHPRLWCNCAPGLTTIILAPDHCDSMIDITCRIRTCDMVTHVRAGN